MISFTATACRRPRGPHLQAYVADAVQVMTENPYRLPETSVASVSTADAIAMKLGIEKTAMIRLRARISYALTEAINGRYRCLRHDAVGRRVARRPPGS